MNCIKLSIRSPYKPIERVAYLPHKLMRQFFGNKDYRAVLNSLAPPENYYIRVGNAESYKVYERDITISSLILLECLLVSGQYTYAVRDNIRKYVKKDYALSRYAINYEFKNVQDIEFAISCKRDYIDVLQQKTALKAKNIIRRYYFKTYVDKIINSKQAVN